MSPHLDSPNLSLSSSPVMSARLCRRQQLAFMWSHCPCVTQPKRFFFTVVIKHFCTPKTTLVRSDTILWYYDMHTCTCKAILLLSGDYVLRHIKIMTTLLHSWSHPQTSHMSMCEPLVTHTHTHIRKYKHTLYMIIFSFQYFKKEDRTARLTETVEETAVWR